MRDGADNRQRLKAATLQAHARTEAAWFGRAAFADLATYRHWLSAMQQVHLGLGVDAAHALGDGAEAARLAALDTDLGNCPQAEHVPQSAPPSWAWGVQYAINGSALGASILMKSAALQPDWPTAYLETMRSYATSGALNAFFQTLNAQDLDHVQATEGATQVFTLLERAHQGLALA